MEFLNEPVVKDKIYLSFCDGLWDLCGDKDGNCDSCYNEADCVSLCNEGCKHHRWWEWWKWLSVYAGKI